MRISHRKGLTLEQEHGKERAIEIIKEMNENRKYWMVFFQSLLSEKYSYQYSEDGKIIINLNERIV